MRKEFKLINGEVISYDSLYIFLFWDINVYIGYLDYVYVISVVING